MLTKLIDKPLKFLDNLNSKIQNSYFKYKIRKFRNNFEIVEDRPPIEVYETKLLEAHRKELLDIRKKEKLLTPEEEWEKFQKEAGPTKLESIYN